MKVSNREGGPPQETATWLGEETVENKALPFLSRKFEAEIENVAEETDQKAWLEDREKVKCRIVENIGCDLNGFILDDLAIDRVKLH